MIYTESELWTALEILLTPDKKNIDEIFNLWLRIYDKISLILPPVYADPLSNLV